jgi:hypothetical protein
MVAGFAWSASRRSIVAWNGLLPSRSGRNCFGQLSRDIGHRRDPAPPARMTG